MYSDTTLPAVIDLSAFDRRRFEVSVVLQSGFSQTLFFTSIDTVAMRIAMDISPRREPNRINPRSNGVVSAAVLTTMTLDATSVDPQSVRLGPGQAMVLDKRDYVRDIDGDGWQDLLVFFKIQETGIRCGDTIAFLTGTTFDGISIEGVDSIETVGCNRHSGAPHSSGHR